MPAVNRSSQKQLRNQHSLASPLTEYTVKVENEKLLVLLMQDVKATVQAIESLCQPKNLIATVKGIEDLIVVENALASKKTVRQIMSEVAHPKQQKQLLSQLSNAREVLIQHTATSKLPSQDESNLEW